VWTDLFQTIERWCEGDRREHMQRELAKAAVDTDESIEEEKRAKAHAAPGEVRQVWENPVLWREIRTLAYGRRPLLVKLAFGAVLALVMYFAVSCVAQEFNTPNEGPAYFIDPGASTSGSYGSSTSGTSTSTSYSRVAPQTSDINPGDTTSTTTDTSSPRGDSTTTRRRPPGDDDPTTSRRPRFNQTRPVFRPIDPYNP
jgi:hypothetical protein